MRGKPLEGRVAIALEPLATSDAHAYWRVFVSGRGDLPTRDLTIHLDRYLALSPDEQRTHFSIKEGGRLLGTVRLSPGEISGFSMDPRHTGETTAALLKCVDFLRAAGTDAITAHFEDRYEAAFASLGFRRIFARMRMEAAAVSRLVPEGVRLVPPEEQEVLGITKFLMEVYDGHLEQAFGLHKGPEEEWRGYVAALFKGESGQYMPDASYVALDDARIVGAILVTHWLGTPLVAELGVAKDRRGKGLGRSLLQTAMNRLATRDETRLALYVTLGNDPAIGLYRSMGFEPVGGQSVTGRMES